MPFSRIRSFFCLSTKVTVTNLLVLAMLFNTAAANALVVGSADRVLVCTSNGFQWIAADAQQNTQTGTGHCVFCLNTDDDDSLAIVRESLLVQANHNNGLIPNYDAHLPSSKHPSARPRAPPESLRFI